jgi:hypothetical protein
MINERTLQIFMEVENYQGTHLRGALVERQNLNFFFW